MRHDPLIRMMLAYPYDLPGYTPGPSQKRHQPSYYLSDEASALRIEALVNRLVKAGPSDPDYARVPASIRAEVSRRTHEPELERAA